MRIGDTVYFLENGRVVRSAVVKRINGNLVIIQLNDGAIQLPIKRLYPSKEDANNALKDKMVKDIKYSKIDVSVKSMAYQTYMYDLPQ